jgi:hypothetical protein
MLAAPEANLDAQQQLASEQNSAIGGQTHPARAAVNDGQIDVDL